MIRRPPISTLFPYTPLSRSGEAARAVPVRVLAAPLSGSGAGVRPRPAALVPPSAQPGPAAAAHRLHLLRSEEHTSELQSRQYLVCRLLLEKKKKTTVQSSIY